MLPRREPNFALQRFLDDAATYATSTHAESVADPVEVSNDHEPIHESGYHKPKASSPNIAWVESRGQRLESVQDEAEISDSIALTSIDSPIVKDGRSSIVHDYTKPAKDLTEPLDDHESMLGSDLHELARPSHKIVLPSSYEQQLQQAEDEIEAPDFVPKYTPQRLRKHRSFSVLRPYYVKSVENLAETLNEHDPPNNPDSHIPKGLSHSIVTVKRHDEQLQQLRDDTESFGGTVPEIIDHLSVGRHRLPTVDLECDPVTLPQRLSYVLAKGRINRETMSEEFRDKANARFWNLCSKPDSTVVDLLAALEIGADFSRPIRLKCLRTAVATCSVIAVAILLRAGVRPTDLEPGLFYTINLREMRHEIGSERLRTMIYVLLVRGGVKMGSYVSSQPLRYFPSPWDNLSILNILAGHRRPANWEWRMDNMLISTLKECRAAKRIAISIGKGADPNAHDRDMKTAFTIAHLIGKGANPNACDRDGHTALTMTIQGNAVTSALVLLMAGADVDKGSYYSQSAIQCAMKYKGRDGDELVDFMRLLSSE